VKTIIDAILFRKGKAASDAAQRASEDDLRSMRQELGALRRQMEFFERFAPTAARKLIRSGAAHDPVTAVKSVLACDIRRFAYITEYLDAAEIISFLNGFYQRMSDAAALFAGYMLQLSGDGFIAVFADADAAINAAIEMRRQLQQMNRERIVGNMMKVECGIGIATGPVAEGTVGSAELTQYCAIGDAINVAVRIEALSRQFSCGVLIDSQTMDSAQETRQARFADRVMLKGREEPFDIYEIFDHEPDDIIQMKQRHANGLAEAFSRYRAGEFVRAAEMYDKLISEVGRHRYNALKCADPVLEFYYKRCRKLAAARMNKMGEWDGVYRFTQK
jgi:adenylate cyclase